tara:strand:- start:1127 stop:1240 length:114 start_codon:yes stop_codon:yes gene_type:complete
MDGFPYYIFIQEFGQANDDCIKVIDDESSSEWKLLRD